MSGPGGLLAVVVAVGEQTARLCHVLPKGGPCHRADLALELGDSLALGVMVGAVLRCRAISRPLRRLVPQAGHADPALLHRILYHMTREDGISRREQAVRRSSGVSTIYE